MDLNDILDRAEQDAPQVKTVRVCVRPSIAVERAGLLDALSAAREEDKRAGSADARLGMAPASSTGRTDAAIAALDAFDEEVAKSLITLRFTRLPGQEWALLTSAFPMRIDVALDRQFGYDYDKVTEYATRRSAVVVDDDGVHEITSDQWDRLFKVLSGHDVEAIRDVVWTLNEWEPQQHVEALVKGSGAA